MAHRSNATFPDTYLLSGERLLWSGRAHGFPIGSWLGALAFWGIFLFALALPIAHFLNSGQTPNFSIRVNGFPLNENTPREELIAVLWMLGAHFIITLGALAIYTNIRMTELYGITDQRVLKLRRFLSFQHVSSLCPQDIGKVHRHSRQNLKTLALINLNAGWLASFYRMNRLTLHDIIDNDGKVESWCTRIAAKSLES